MKAVFELVSPTSLEQEFSRNRKILIKNMSGLLDYIKDEQKLPKIITLAEMEPFLFQLVGEPLFENQKAAYLAYSNGKVSTCPIQTLGKDLK